MPNLSKFKSRKNIKKFLIGHRKTIREAMRQINNNGHGIVFIVDQKHKFIGVATDGDIRRALIGGSLLTDPVATITNTRCLKLTTKNWKQYLKLIPQDKIPQYPTFASLKIPILNSNKQIVDMLILSQTKGKIDHQLLSQSKKNTHPQNIIKTVLVVGGAGYLGSVLCRLLLRSGYKVRILDNLTYGNYGIRELLSNKNVTLTKGDIRSISDIVEACKNTDAIIHLAALVGDSASAISPQQTLETNYHSTKLIVELAKYYQINRFIFASTCSVYGKSLSPKIPLTEDSTLNPISLYAKTKLQSEDVILEATDNNFSPTILRMATIYGISPRMRFDLVVNLLAAKAFFEKQIPVFGGNQYRPFVHIKDAARGFIACLRAPISKIKGQIFNLGSNDQNHKIIYLARKINTYFPKSKLIIKKDKIDERDYFTDFSKIKTFYKNFPLWDIDRSLDQFKKVFHSGKYRDFSNDQFSNIKYLASISL